MYLTQNNRLNIDVWAKVDQVDTRFERLEHQVDPVDFGNDIIIHVNGPVDYNVEDFSTERRFLLRTAQEAT